MALWMTWLYSGGTIRTAFCLILQVWESFLMLLEPCRSLLWTAIFKLASIHIHQLNIFYHSLSAVNMLSVDRLYFCFVAWWPQAYVKVLNIKCSSHPDASMTKRLTLLSLVDLVPFPIACRVMFVSNWISSTCVPNSHQERLHTLERDVLSGFVTVDLESNSKALNMG